MLKFSGLWYNSGRYNLIFIWKFAPFILNILSSFLYLVSTIIFFHVLIFLAFYSWFEYRLGVILSFNTVNFWAFSSKEVRSLCSMFNFCVFVASITINITLKTDVLLSCIAVLFVYLNLCWSLLSWVNRWPILQGYTLLKKDGSKLFVRYLRRVVFGSKKVLQLFS